MTSRFEVQLCEVTHKSSCKPNEVQNSVLVSQAASVLLTFLTPFYAVAHVLVMYGPDIMTRPLHTGFEKRALVIHAGTNTPVALPPNCTAYHCRALMGDAR